MTELIAFRAVQGLGGGGLVVVALAVVGDLVPCPHAVLLLLARLGLRAVEVSRLPLDELDWRAEQTVVDGKAHRRDQLQVPSDVGEAIVVDIAQLAVDRAATVDLSSYAVTTHDSLQPAELSGDRRQGSPGRGRRAAAPA